MKNALTLVLAAGLAASTASSARAADPARGGEPKGAVSDKLFVAAAAAAGMAEVGTSKLALERAGSDEIKQYAQRMVDEHTKANKELLTLASQKGMAVPTELSFQDQAEANALAGLSGEDFDCAYAKGQLAAHICAVGLFTAEAERGQDPELKAWAAKTLPSLKEHKKMIQKKVEMYEKKEMEKEKSSAAAH